MASLPNIKVKTVRNVILSVSIVVFSFLSGYWFGIEGLVLRVNGLTKVKIDRTLPLEKKDLDFNLFWKVWDEVHAKYFDKSKLVDSNMVYGAIKGMVSAIGDPYTVYLPPEENKLVQEDLQGTFEGVGIQIGFKGSQLVVISPLPGSPAEKKGIKAGDFIVEIKDAGRGIDINTFGITLPEAVQAIRGKSGTKVTLTILREGVNEPFEVEIERKTIDVPSVTVEYLNGDRVAHIKILKFSRETLDEWEEKVRDILKRRELSAIILDLRNNPGGFMEDSINIASDFLDTGSVVVVEERGDGTKTEHKVSKLGRLRNYQVLVLINKGSASASEILAGALRDNNRAQLVGEETFGKGTIQDPIQIPGNGGLHVTVARWLTPSGFWVNEKGLKPDFEVKDNDETIEDEQLNKALEVLQARSF